VVDKFVSTESLGFIILPPSGKYIQPGSGIITMGGKLNILTKKEVSDVVDTIERINDYISVSGEKLFIHVHYYEVDRKTMVKKPQNKMGRSEKDIDSVQELLLNYSFDENDGGDKNYLSEISVVVNNEK
jgi:hypothetical protein